MTASRTPKVTVPSRPSADGVQLGRVGVIAVVGFAIGIVWPRLAGVSLVPSAPVEGARQDALAAQETAPEAEDRSAPAPEPPPPSPGERLVVDDFQVTSCRDAQGKTVKDCGDFDARALLGPALRGLGTCPAAENAVGKLSVGMDIDLKARRITEPKSGRSTDLPAAVTRGLLACVARQLEGVQWKGIEGAQPAYTVYALVEFKRPEQVLAQAIVPASGSATVRWNVALVRAEPETKAKVRARLTSGTRVIVSARQAEWYRVSYDTKGGEGWVHGAAIGMDVGDSAAPDLAAPDPASPDTAAPDAP